MFYKNDSDKPTATSPTIDTTLSMVRLIVQPMAIARSTKLALKQKHKCPAKNGVNKQAKSWPSNLLWLISATLSLVAKSVISLLQKLVSVELSYWYILYINR